MNQAQAPAIELGGQMQAQTNPVSQFASNGVTLFDQKGETLPPVTTPTLMARLNEKGKEEFTITKGMFALIGATAVVIGLLITSVVLLVGWAREDQANRGKNAELEIMLKGLKDTQDVREAQRMADQQRIEKNQEKLSADFEKIIDQFHQQALKDERAKGQVQGYGVGRTDKTTGH